MALDWDYECILLCVFECLGPFWPASVNVVDLPV